MGIKADDVSTLLEVARSDWTLLSESSKNDL